MVLAEYLERKYYGPRRRRELAEAKAKGRDEGREEGRDEGRKEFIAEIRAWNDRRLDAESKGEPFDEPPPLDD